MKPRTIRLTVVVYEEDYHTAMEILDHAESELGKRIENVTFFIDYVEGGILP